MLKNRFILTALAAGLLAVPAVSADAPGYFKLPGTDTTMQVYGRVMFDAVDDFVQNSGANGGLSGAAASASDDSKAKNQVDFVANDSRIGIRTATPTEMGDVTTRVEGDFGGKFNGKSVGNGFNLRQAYAEIGGWTFGKRDTNFFDLDGSPDYLDEDGLLADFYGPGRYAQIRYTANFNEKTVGAISLENAGVTPSSNPNAAAAPTFQQNIPAIVGNIHYADKWGHIAASVAYQQYKTFANNYVAGTDATYTINQTTGQVTLTPVKAAVAGGTSSTSKDSLSFSVSGNINIGDDSFVAHYALGNGTYGAGLMDGPIVNKSGSLDIINASQFDAGYTHVWTPKVRSNVFGSLVTYSSDDNKFMNTDAFKSYTQVGANTIVNIGKNVQYGFEYIWGAAKTFDNNTIVNPDGSKTDTVHESKLRFQFKVNFF